MTFSFCEPVWATPTSRIHIREHEGERKVGGGINTPTLCGRMMNYGWDLEGEVTVERIDARLAAETGPTCPDCALAWKIRHGYAQAPPPPTIQGVRPQHVIFDEAVDVGF